MIAVRGLCQNSFFIFVSIWYRSFGCFRCAHRTLSSAALQLQPTAALTQCSLRAGELSLESLKSAFNSDLSSLPLGSLTYRYGKPIAFASTNDTVDRTSSAPPEDIEPQEKLKEFMLSSIKWYKSSLSPIMPPNCRFLPTCSSYGLEAIETFGPWKGGILTAWRIFRCNPSGGSGYDPPMWPPPPYFAGSTSWWNRNRRD